MSVIRGIVWVWAAMLAVALGSAFLVFLLTLR